MPRLAYLRQPTPADARCAAGNRETRNARNPTAQRQTETAPAPKKTAATRKIATVFGSPRFGQCSDFHILAHRSSSVRFHAPRSRSPVLLVSVLFRAPRYSAQRGTLRPVRAQRRPARRYSHCPDHRTNYPNIAGRNAEGRGEAAGTENPAEDTASAPPDSGKRPAAPVRTGIRAASEIHPPPGMQPRAPESVQLLATAVPAVRLEARTHTSSFEKHIRSRRSRTFARFTKPEQIPGGTPRPPLQTISTDSRIVIRTG